jgi:L-ascorbate metabolism protein UlaG (beta-lactamase superfamily)
MRVGILGHAGLVVETRDQLLYVDPVFVEKTLLDGILEYAPRRAMDLARLPRPTAIVVTHAHFDHFHAASLERLPRDVPVVVSADDRLIEGLRRLGFADLRICAPWDVVTLGATRLVATPSGHEEPEMGVVVADGEATFWHMADAEVKPEDGARVLAEHGRVDVVSAKYQPVVRASMGHLRARGARFDTQEVVDWLESACAVEPGFVFPYASGLAFAGRHAWFNRYAFPLSPDEVAELLQKRLGGAERAAAVLPGDAVDVVGGRVTHVKQALGFVTTTPTTPVAWEPVDVSTLAGTGDAAERARLEAKLDTALEGPMRLWLERELERPGSFLRPLRRQGVVWQLVVEAGGGERIERHIEYGAVPLAIGRGRHPRPRSFTHVSGRSLLDALEGTIAGIVFWLAGDARSYEKNIFVEGGRLVAPPVPFPEDEIGDPLTYWLRYYGPRGERLGQPLPGAAPEREETSGDADEPDDVWLLARQGEKRAVVEKKALLALLAEQEAERLSVPITDDDVQLTSDTFRTQCGLHDEAETLRWFERAGLTQASYARVMRRYTAVRLVQARRAADIAAVLEDHARVSTARRR